MDQNQLNDNLLKVKNLFSKATKGEKELYVLLKKRGPFDKHVRAARESVRESYEQVLLSDPDFAATKDVDQQLWKAVYYKAIEEIRRLIRQYHSSVTGADARNPEAKEKLHKLCAAFQEFLEEANAYYTSLARKLQQIYETDPMLRDRVLSSMHKCFIILGDLARYSELYNESNTKDWSTAAGYYVQALAMIPTNGNPHNQLAVLASYQKDDCEAIYRYFRSLAVKKPFSSARDNLIALFENNRQRLQEASKKEDSKSGTRRNKGKKTIEEKLEAFMLRFVRAHGILFTRISLEMMPKIQNGMLRKFIDLLKAGVLSDNLVLKIITMNIFAVESCLSPIVGSGTSTTDQSQAASELAQRAVLSQAYSLSLNMYIKVTNAAIKASTFCFLGAIATFLKWLDRRFAYVVTEQLHHRENEKLVNHMLAISSELVESFAQFHIPQHINDAIQGAKPLHEDTELAGFEPLDGRENRPLPTNRPSVDASAQSTANEEEIALSQRIERIRTYWSSIQAKLQQQQNGGDISALWQQQQQQTSGPQPTAAHSNHTQVHFSVAKGDSLLDDDEDEEAEEEPAFEFEEEEEEADDAQTNEHNSALENTQLPHDAVAATSNEEEDEDDDDEEIIFRPPQSVTTQQQQQQQQHDIRSNNSSSSVPQPMFASTNSSGAGFMGPSMWQTQQPTLFSAGGLFTTPLPQQQHSGVQQMYQSQTAPMNSPWYGSVAPQKAQHANSDRVIERPYAAIGQPIAGGSGSAIHSAGLFSWPSFVPANGHPQFPSQQHQPQQQQQHYQQQQQPQQQQPQQQQPYSSFYNMPY